MKTLITFLVLTAFWIIVALVGCLVAKRFKERGVIKCCVILTAVCCWLLWVSTFLMQLNPLIGPRVDQIVIFGMMSYWENSYVINGDEDK
ncbi:V-type proton ATPase subunit e [Drosophila sulfurigaster albostrigata]|uniref:V-type proton ATPase subunit e n=1 Tax=Drosophila sulfurigaster albostrigata TaxID=89887 RepID=UPI002D21B83F|nr:V-type proton ATPase subunit e [Drosophila sulfurigaster albostrigata]